MTPSKTPPQLPEPFAYCNKNDPSADTAFMWRGLGHKRDSLHLLYTADQMHAMYQQGYEAATLAAVGRREACVIETLLDALADVADTVERTPGVGAETYSASGHSDAVRIANAAIESCDSPASPPVEGQRAVHLWVEPTNGMTAAEAISELRTSNDFYARIEGNDFGGMETAIAVVEKMALALDRLIEAADDSDSHCYGTLSTSFVRDVANQPFSVEQKS